MLKYGVDYLNFKEIGWAGRTEGRRRRGATRKVNVVYTDIRNGPSELNSGSL